MPRAALAICKQLEASDCLQHHHVGQSVTMHMHACKNARTSDARQHWRLPHLIMHAHIKKSCTVLLSWGSVVERQKFVDNPCTDRRTGAYTKAVGTVPSVHAVAIKQAALFVIIGRQGLDQARGRAASAPHIKPLSETCHQPSTRGPQVHHQNTLPYRQKQCLNSDL